MPLNPDLYQSHYLILWDVAEVWWQFNTGPGTAHRLSTSKHQVLFENTYIRDHNDYMCIIQLQNSHKETPHKIPQEYREEEQLVPFKKRPHMVLSMNLQPANGCWFCFCFRVNWNKVSRWGLRITSEIGCLP